MGYSDTLTSTQKRNISVIIDRLLKAGITNKFVQAAILAVISKESSFIPKSERSYANTSNDRIRSIFSRTRKLTDDQLTVLKKNPKQFFDFVYDYKIGNKKGEGYKFRGRGLNQITGRANYEKVNKYVDADIVKYPDKLNEIKHAADALIGFYKKAFKSRHNKLHQYNMSSFNDAKKLMDAVGAVYHANTGWGKTKSKIEREPTGGYKKTIARAPSLLQYIGGAKKKEGQSTISIARTKCPNCGYSYKSKTNSLID